MFLPRLPVSERNVNVQNQALKSFHCHFKTKAYHQICTYKKRQRNQTEVCEDVWCVVCSRESELLSVSVMERLCFGTMGLEIAPDKRIDQAAPHRPSSRHYS